MSTDVTRRSIVKMFDAMEGGPSPAECSRIEQHPPSSPITSCGETMLEE